MEINHRSTAAETTVSGSCGRKFVSPAEYSSLYMAVPSRNLTASSPIQPTAGRHAVGGCMVTSGSIDTKVTIDRNQLEGHEEFANILLL